MALTNVDLYRIDGTIGSVSNISTASLNGGPLAGTRNRIINGDMRIDQRNAGAAVTIDNNFVYTLDRWQPEDATDGVFTCQRSTVAPTGFTNSLLLTVTTADTSLAASQFAYVRQCIEGFNIVDFGWGTASAQAVTLSFWVRSSITGTFGGSIKNSASNRAYPFTYAITSANTWEYKTIIIPGDTSGTWLADNGLGLQLLISIGAGSTLSGAAGAWAGANYVSATGATPLIGTNGATFYITGVQLEAGTVATPFERRSYGQELALCQRYFEKKNYNSTAYERISTAFVPGTSTSTLMETVFTFTEKRALPSVTTSAGNTFRQNGGNALDNIGTSVSVGTIGLYTFNLAVNGNSRNSGTVGWISRENVATTFIEISAEL